MIANCRLVTELKRRRGTDAPRLTLQYLEFPFNGGEADALRRLANDLDMRFLAFRGATPDPRWAQKSGWPPWWMTHAPRPCPFLWGEPVLTVDGNVAPCHGAFQSCDDFAHLATTPTEHGAPSFAAAWNGPRYRIARGFFSRRNGSVADRQLICHDCPTTIFYERWRAHRAAGGSPDTFAPGMELGANAPWNYFWERGQHRRPPAGPLPAPCEER